MGLAPPFRLWALNGRWSVACQPLFSGTARLIVGGDRLSQSLITAARRSLTRSVAPLPGPLLSASMLPPMLITKLAAELKAEAAAVFLRGVAGGKDPLAPARVDPDAGVGHIEHQKISLEVAVDADVGVFPVAASPSASIASTEFFTRLTSI